MIFSLAVFFFFFFFCSSRTFTFQLLGKSWSQVSSLLPPRFLPSIFIAHTKGSAIPLLVDFSSSVVYTSHYCCRFVFGLCFAVLFVPGTLKYSFAFRYSFFIVVVVVVFLSFTFCDHIICISLLSTTKNRDEHSGCSTDGVM